MDQVNLNNDDLECPKDPMMSSQVPDTPKSGCETTSGDCMKNAKDFHDSPVIGTGRCCRKQTALETRTGHSEAEKDTKRIILSPLEAVRASRSSEQTRRTGNATKCKPSESILRKRHTSANISTFPKLWEHEENPKPIIKKKTSTKSLLLCAEESQENTYNSSYENRLGTLPASAINKENKIKLVEDNISEDKNISNTLSCSSLMSSESTILHSMETCSMEQSDAKPRRNIELPHPPIIPVEDEALINNSEIWPKVAYSVISELTMQQHKFIPTPFLVSHDQTYLPLQVFLAEEGSLSFRPFAKLDRLKKLDQESKRRHGRSQYRDFTLKEITRDTDAQQMFNFVQTTSLSRQNSTTTRNGHHCKFQIQVLKTYVKQIDVRNLIDCKLDEKSPIMRRKLKKFFVIDECWMATEARCSVIFGDTLSDTTSTRYCVKRLCPFAFHVVQVSVNKKGLVTNVSFDIKEDKLPTFQRIIIPVKEFFLTR
ncbi:uncharacterized protein LOC117101068 [Anneissia japonica]|uniref:uncharacterized protein LOC117101068 n=1 Tax=Anneissia japonica TaxID=1529436 RepID=UPI0014259261|nr:uncharacterized protein LOC117101068 [Anneissia japonica]